VICCALDVSTDHLRDTIESVLAQDFRDWELMLVMRADAGTERTYRHLAEIARDDERVKVCETTSNGTVAAWSAGLAGARGDFVALLDGGDVLAADALSVNARIIECEPDVDYLYSDEDLFTDDRHHDPSAKPVWSPERLRNQDYCGRLSVFRTSLVRAVGGFREESEGAPIYDLTLRVTECSRRVIRIPKVLYHRRERPDAGADEPDRAFLEAGRRAVEDQLHRQGIAGTASIGPHGYFEIHRELPADRRVSIVIPTIGSSAVIWGARRCFVTEAVRSALAHTDHENLEIVVVYDAPTPADVLEDLRAIAGKRLVLVPFLEPFNYSRKVNLGVLASTGDRIVVLNDDIEVRSDRWVEELVAPLEEADVGMTGAKLYFSSTAIQHAGLAFTHGRFKHPYYRAPEGTVGDAGALLVNREVSGVTGACVGIRRELFLEIGGLCEELPDSFNDVDFSYKVLESGHRVLVMVRCELFHFETQTRVPLRDPREAEFVRGRWGVPFLDAYTPRYPDMPRPLEDRLA
jgi:GT2 family glycosyltransferase